MTILKQRYLLHKVFFISVFVLLLFSSCRSKIGGYDNPTGGGGYDNSNYVIPITENKLDVSGDFYNGKQLYLIKVNTDTSTGTGGYANAEETGSLNSSLYNYEENVNTKEFDIAKVNDKSEPVLVHIPFSPAEKPPILKSSLDKLKSKEYNQKVPTTGNSFIIDDVTYSIPMDSDHYYAGEHCNVWYCSEIHPRVAVNYSHIGSVTLKSIADKFDAIYEKETALLGNIYWKENEVLSDGYISQDLYFVAPTMNTKIDIVFYDMNYYSESSFRGGTGGYFWSADMICLEGYNFNGRLMLHLDSGFLEDSLNSAKVPYNTYSTLVHEFNHLLNFVNRQLKYGMTRNGHIDKVPHDTWFT